MKFEETLSPEKIGHTHIKKYAEKIQQAEF